MRGAGGSSSQLPPLRRLLAQASGAPGEGSRSSALPSLVAPLLFTGVWAGRAASLHLRLCCAAKGTPAVCWTKLTWRACREMKPAGSKQWGCALCSHMDAAASRPPLCISDSSNGKDKPCSSGRVATFALGFWGVDRAPPGKRASSPVGLCHDTVRKHQSRMRPRQKQGLEPCCHHFDQFGTEMPVRSCALVIFPPPCHHHDVGLVLAVLCTDVAGDWQHTRPGHLAAPPAKWTLKGLQIHLRLLLLQ